jgi:hypothetical protein
VATAVPRAPVAPVAPVAAAVAGGGLVVVAVPVDEVAVGRVDRRDWCAPTRTPS